MSTPTNSITAKENLNWILNIAYAIAFACIGFIVNMGFNHLNTLEEKSDQMPFHYVHKDDYIEDRKQLRDSLHKISDKLDHNAEYIEADYNRRMDKLEAQQSAMMEILLKLQQGK